jgi:peptide/nickel transport system permease protein
MAAAARPRLRVFLPFLYLLPAIILIVVALWPRSVLPHSPTQVAGNASVAPNGMYWFGTDANGLDVFSRTIAAGRLDLLIGLGTSVITVLLACAIGLAIGYREDSRKLAGTGARISARLVELFQSIPPMVGALVAVAVFGTSTFVMMIAIAIVLTPGQVRLVRTEVQKVKGEGYVEAARTFGMRDWEVALRRVLPNAAWPVIENWPLLFASAIMIIAALGFLGVGFPPPTPEWGSMIATGASDAAVGRWWSFVFPALALSFTVFAAMGVRRAWVIWYADVVRRPKSTESTRTWVREQLKTALIRSPAR